MKRILKILIIFSLLSNLYLANANSLFREAKTSTEILNHLRNIPRSSIIFIDIDDTIITSASKTFRRPPYNKMIDEIKEDHHKYKNFEEILSNWRMQRKIMLLDADWPNIINLLKRQYPVYGLTKMNSGKFGSIISMEKWRYEELKSLGIEFSNENLIPEDSISNATFYKGLFITGSDSKSRTIFYYMKWLKAETFVMIDDREEHLKDIQEFCVQNKIQFIGILFKGLENYNDIPNPKVVALQKKYLTEQAKWLEDEEAEKMLVKN